MQKIDTGYPLILRFDNFLDIKICNKIISFMNEIKNIDLIKNNENLPWFENDNVEYNKIQNIEIKNHIKIIKYNVANLISANFKQKYYPHFSDLVLWREGKSMLWHKDNDNNLKSRVFSAVCYINDNYTGGETLIKQNNKIYTSRPKKGSLICFTSDERCEHSVSKIMNGNRITLAMWFTTNVKEIEKN